MVARARLQNPSLSGRAFPRGPPGGFGFGFPALGTSRARLERSPSELNRGRDSRIGFDLLEDSGRGKEAAGMALSDDLRERVVGAVVEGGMSRLFRRLRRGETVVPVE